MRLMARSFWTSTHKDVNCSVIMARIEDDENKGYCKVELGPRDME